MNNQRNKTVKRESEISREWLKSKTFYSPKTGKMYKRYSYGLKLTLGTDLRGYLRIKLKYKEYKQHRVAWFYMYGCWPVNHVDHINGDTADNRIENLRECSETQNAGNSKLSDANTSGVKGVYWAQAQNKWVAQITKQGRTYHLGCYDSIDDAGKAYEKAAKGYFGEFARV